MNWYHGILAMEKQLSNNFNLSTQEYIDWLQRYIIVHSYVYYETDDEFISDREYDVKSKELTRLKNGYPELWKSSEYYKQFGDEYNGSTGFTLYHDLNARQQNIIKSIVNGIKQSKRK